MTLVYIAIILLILWIILGFNNLVTYTNRAKEAWSDIDVQLKRRYDLIPNLVNTVKGYAAHESTTLDNVIKARNSAMSATTPREHSQTEDSLAGALKSVFALSESYPDLKANQNFLQLQKELGDTEDKIQASRRFYNGVVRDLNTMIETFPNNLLANTFKFTKQDFFDLTSAPAERNAIEVKF
ncbi:MAG: LemA family protein [Candidatus Vogelbacteria bacterium]|nr:LemA family protein [Candidatus Vogelbacteria bacterium]